MISTPPTDIITATIRENITALLRESHAHIRFEDAVDAIPADERTVCPEQVPYSIWQLVEHIRITQWDMLEFCRSATHQSPQWPEGYWTPNPAFADDEMWKNSLLQIRKDKEAFIALFNNPDTDIYLPFPYGNGQTFIRQALFIADHTAYHTGQIVLLRRMLNLWGK